MNMFFFNKTGLFSYRSFEKIVTQEKSTSRRGINDLSLFPAGSAPAPRYFAIVDVRFMQSPGKP
jgi:hypothetical protein